MTNYIIEATADEIRALQQMLHRACLHSGMDVADAAAHWNRKLVETLKPVRKANGNIETVNASESH